MDNKEQLKILFEICGQDLQIIDSEEKLKRLSQESSQARQEALLLEAKISELNNKRTESLKTRRLFDEKLHLEKSNLRKWETRAEKIKGEREYTALMSEIEAQKRSISHIEDDIAKIDAELKSNDSQLKKTGGSYEEKIKVADASHLSVKDSLEKETEILNNDQQIRADLLSKLSPSLKARYKRIYERRSRQGIAFLRDSVCQACMRKVPPELFIRICKGEVIEQCPSCQRILVADMPT